MKPIELDRYVYRTFMVKNVFTGILAASPDKREGTIKSISIMHGPMRILKTHNCSKRAAIWMDLQVKAQPPNSPEVNALYFCFFNTLKSLKYLESPITTVEIFDAVKP